MPFRFRTSVRNIEQEDYRTRYSTNGNSIAICLTCVFNIHSMISKWGIEMRLKKKYEADLNYYKEGKGKIL